MTGLIYRADALRRRLCARVIRPRGGSPLHSPLACQKGFTLVEFLVSLTLLAIGIFAVLGMQIFAMNSNKIAHRLTVATSLAQQVSEEVMLWDPATAKGQCFKTDGTYSFYADPNYPALATLTVQGAGTFTPTYTTTAGTGANGVPVGVTRVVVLVTGVGRTITVTGFKRTV